MAKRPKVREKKDDRLLFQRSTQNQIRCDMSLAPLDRAMAEIEKKWGINRLPELISVESADKWAKAVFNLNSAVDSEDPEKVKFWVEVCLRGLKAMDEEAVKMGHQISDPMIWEYEYEGTTFAIIEDGREWPAAYEKRKGIAIHTMREVAIALHAQRNGIVDAVKLAFPGAEVQAIRTPNESMDDSAEFLTERFGI